MKQAIIKKIRFDEIERDDFLESIETEVFLMNGLYGQSFSTERTDARIFESKKSAQDFIKWHQLYNCTVEPIK